jgi:hypothetical protein
LLSGFIFSGSKSGPAEESTADSREVPARRQEKKKRNT